MHVLHIFNEINFSGAEIMYADAAPLFQEKGVKMTAVNTGEKMGNFIAEFEKANISIINRPLSAGYKNPFLLIGYFRSMYYYIKKGKVDIIHVHRSDVFWYFAVCGTLAGIKTIMTPHNIFKNRKITWIKAYLERLTARKLFNTTFQTISETVYKNELTYYKTPSVRINNWYNNNRYFPARENEKSKLRKELGIAENDFVVISTGSCTAIKNHGAIIEALAMVEPDFPCTYLHLGKGSLEDDEMKKACDLHLDHRVHFLGNRVNVRDYLIASDLYIMTSFIEGLSIAAIEAMACKLPCILYNSPGLRDLITNDDNGFIVDQDARKVAEKIILFRNDKHLLREKGNNGYRFVTTNFNFQTGVNNIFQLYKTILPQ